jgi:hypothetical protein
MMAVLQILIGFLLTYLVTETWATRISWSAFETTFYTLLDTLIGILNFATPISLIIGFIIGIVGIIVGHRSRNKKAKKLSIIGVISNVIAFFLSLFFLAWIFMIGVG